MKIKLIRSLAGADVLPAGLVIDTTEKEAKSLVNAGFAEYYTGEIETTENKGFQARKKAVKRKRRQ